MAFGCCVQTGGKGKGLTAQSLGVVYGRMGGGKGIGQVDDVLRVPCTMKLLPYKTSCSTPKDGHVRQVLGVASHLFAQCVGVVCAGLGRADWWHGV